MLRASHPETSSHADVLTLAAGTWLACGIVLLGLTPLPLHTVAAGWTPLFALVLAPAIVLGARHVFATAPQGARAVAAGVAAARLPRHRDSAVRVPATRRLRTQRRRNAPRAALRQASGISEHARHSGVTAASSR